MDHGRWTTKLAKQYVPETIIWIAGTSTILPLNICGAVGWERGARRVQLGSAAGYLHVDADPTFGFLARNGTALTQQLHESAR